MDFNDTKEESLFRKSVYNRSQINQLTQDWVVGQGDWVQLVNMARNDIVN